jgi:hypothetical protein
MCQQIDRRARGMACVVEEAMASRIVIGKSDANQGRV